MPHAAGHDVWLPVRQPPRHSAVHAHEALQSIPLEQLLTAPHAAVQAPVPHWMPAPQLPLPAQVAMQSTLAAQLIPLLHVPVAEHSTSQLAAEQVTGA